jgi:hypothetical protein
MLWQFFRRLFAISFSKIFELFKTEKEFQSCFCAIEQTVVGGVAVLSAKLEYKIRIN